MTRCSVTLQIMFILISHQAMLGNGFRAGWQTTTKALSVQFAGCSQPPH